MKLFTPPVFPPSYGSSLYLFCENVTFANFQRNIRRPSDATMWNPPPALTLCQAYLRKVNLCTIAIRTIRNLQSVSPGAARRLVRKIKQPFTLRGPPAFQHIHALGTCPPRREAVVYRDQVQFIVSWQPRILWRCGRLCSLSCHLHASTHQTHMHSQETKVALCAVASS